MKNWRVTFIRHRGQLSLQPGFLFAGSDQLSFKLMHIYPLMTLIWEKAKHRRWKRKSIPLICMWKTTQIWCWSSWTQRWCWRPCHALWLFLRTQGVTKTERLLKHSSIYPKTGFCSSGKLNELDKQTQFYLPVQTPFHNACPHHFASSKNFSVCFLHCLFHTEQGWLGQSKELLHTFNYFPPIH